MTMPNAVDVLVIGSGFAGLSAAIEAKKHGATVAVIEKSKLTGGNSRKSDGGVAAPMTDIQEKYGYVDSEEQMFEDMMASGLYINHPNLVKTFVKNAKTAFEWTRDDLGVMYKDRIDIFGGHSVHRCYTAEHVTGATILKKQLERLQQLEVPIYTGVYFDHFLTDETGAVVGAHVYHGHDIKKISWVMRPTSHPKVWCWQAVATEQMSLFVKCKIPVWMKALITRTITPPQQRP